MLGTGSFVRGLTCPMYPNASHIHTISLPPTSRRQTSPLSSKLSWHMDFDPVDADVHLSEVSLV
jgi:hypothetical protein